MVTERTPEQSAQFLKDTIEHLLAEKNDEKLTKLANAAERWSNTNSILKAKINNQEKGIKSLTVTISKFKKWGLTTDVLESEVNTLTKDLTNLKIGYTPIIRTRLPRKFPKKYRPSILQSKVE